MTSKYFESMLDQTARTFAYEKSRSEGISESEAIIIGRGQISDILSEGQNTPGNHFLQIQLNVTDKLIGYVWMGLKERPEGREALSSCI